MTIYFVSLGCDKNLVDSERMIGVLSQKGYSLVQDPAQADVLIVNTCSFILDAQDESVRAILEMAEYRKSGTAKALLVTGCMAQRFADDIRAEIPEVDAVIGTGSIDKIDEAVRDALGGNYFSDTDTPGKFPGEEMPRLLSTPSHYGYLKISEGCAKHCSYCIIPSLRGPYRSEPMEELVAEARKLAAFGVKELILVAQETTLYGIDIYGEKRLPQLLRALSEVEGIEWIRLLYCYPEEITPQLVQEMKENPKVCHYLDLPIQHADDDILKRMGRRTSREELLSLIQYLREEIPDICLRTSLITGFPGETEEMHQQLLDFVKEVRFDHLGVFPYSREDGTPAARFPDQVPEEVKERRRDEIMQIQQEVSLQRNKELVGRTMQVLVDGYLPDDDVYAGRTYRDAPDVDGMIFLSSDCTLMSGDMVDAVVTEASEYDLIGEYENEPAE
jgi:ribosomal protein S12 methylthiotransferase